MPCYIFDTCIIIDLEQTGLLEDFEKFCKDTGSTVRMSSQNHDELRRRIYEKIDGWPFFEIVQASPALINSLASEHRAASRSQGGTRTLSNKDISVLAVGIQAGCKCFCVTNDAALLIGINAYLVRHPEQDSIKPLAFAGLLLSMHENDKMKHDPRWLVDASITAIENIECGRIFHGITDMGWTEENARYVFKPYTVNFKKAVSYGV